MSSWDEIVNTAVKEITEVFEEKLKITLSDDNIIEISAIRDEKESVVLSGQFAEIVDCHLAFSIPNYYQIKKEQIKTIEYKKITYRITHKPEKKEGFTKYYLKRA